MVGVKQIARFLRRNKSRLRPRDHPYRPNFWNLIRLGMISVIPRRRFLSSS
jgi:hypothetical protein